MDIRILKPGDERRLERFLGKHADSSMILRSNLRAVGICDSGEPYCGTYAGAFERGSLVGVVAHYWNGTLVCQAPVRLLSALGGAAVQASKRAVAGVLGPADQVAVLLRRFRRRIGKPRLDSLEGLYGLHLSGLRRPASLYAQRLQARRLEPGDRKTVVGWLDAYEVEALGGTPGRDLTAASGRRFERTCADGRGYLLLRDGVPVALSGFNAELADAVQVGPVYTPPGERGKGFARAVVAHSLVGARVDGVRRAVLFTGDENIAAIRAYRALGFERVGDFRLALA